MNGLLQQILVLFVNILYLYLIVTQVFALHLIPVIISRMSRRRIRRPYKTYASLFCLPEGEKDKEREG